MDRTRMDKARARRRTSRDLLVEAELERDAADERTYSAQLDRDAANHRLSKSEKEIAFLKKTLEQKTVQLLFEKEQKAKYQNTLTAHKIPFPTRGPKAVKSIKRGLANIPEYIPETEGESGPSTSTQMDVFALLIAEKECALTAAQKRITELEKGNRGEQKTGKMVKWAIPVDDTEDIMIDKVIVNVTIDE